MAATEYHLVTRWDVDGTAEEVGAIFSDTASLVRWFPATYLNATVLRPGVPGGDLDKVVSMRVKGWMPHTLSFIIHIVQAAPPLEFVAKASGDFEGDLRCWSEPHGNRLAVFYDWRIRVTKPFVRHLSRVLRPLFVSNHLWVIARGEESLNLELRRRRAALNGVVINELPPGPTFPHGPLSAYVRSRVWSRATLHDMGQSEGQSPAG